MVPVHPASKLRVQKYVIKYLWEILNQSLYIHGVTEFQSSEILWNSTHTTHLKDAPLIHNTITLKLEITIYLGC